MRRFAQEKEPMNEDDQALQVEVLAAALHSDRKEAKSTIEYLAKRFEAMLPDHTTVVRGGWLLSSDKPVKELKIEFDDFHYILNSDRQGVTGKELKIVRGVVLKSREVSLEEWINLMADALMKYAEKNASARQALSDFLIGR
jgi:hypothetical protein